MTQLFPLPFPIHIHTSSHQVLETCVKNCGRPFHMQVTERTFCDVLFKLVSISNNGRGTIGGLSREKALGMIQSWADVRDCAMTVTLMGL